MTLTRLAVGGALFLGALPASADIQAEDVWKNYQAQVSSFGGRLEGTVDRSGRTVVINDQTLSAQFPMGAGSFSLTLPPMTLMEEAGEVAFDYPDAFVLDFELVLADVGRSTGRIVFETESFAGVASGEPDSIAYRSRVDRSTLGLSEVVWNGQSPDISGTITSEPVSVMTRVDTGPMILMSSEIFGGASEFEFSFVDATGGRTETSGSQGAVRSQSTITLPASGVPWMDITGALTDGTRFSGTSVIEGSDTLSQTFLDGTLISEQRNQSKNTKSLFSLNADGLRLEGESLDILSVLELEDVGIPSIVFEASKINGALLVPLIAKPDPQKSVVQMGVEGLRLAPPLWAQVDPGKLLRRDPIDFALDLEADLDWQLNALDWEAWSTIEDPEELPIDINSITLTKFVLRALGAEVLAEANALIDLSDFETFDGFPKVEGEATVTMRGIDALIAQLDRAGIIVETDFDTAQFGLGMFTREIGPDERRITAEINSDGHIFANGERVR